MYNSDVEGLDAFVSKYKTLNKEIGKVIIGQEDVVKEVLITIFSLNIIVKKITYNVQF